MSESVQRSMTITIELNPETVAFLDALAEIKGCDRSYLINEALEQYVEHRRCMIEETKKAVAEADAGELLSEKESEAFMRELTAE